MMLKFQVLTWDRHKNVVGLNQLMGSQPSPSWYLDLQWQYIYMYKQTIKTCTLLITRILLYYICSESKNILEENISTITIVFLNTATGFPQF